MISKMKYVKIIQGLCQYYGIEQNRMIDLLEEKENKYLLLLLLKNNSCLEKNNIKKILKVKSSKSVNNNLKIAEEKLLINRQFREKYFEIQDNIDRFQNL